MYLHLGNDIIVKISDIIGIFDLENTTVNKETREFLSVAEEEGFIRNISDEMPKSIVVTEENNNSVIYLSPLSVYTLRKRLKEDCFNYSKGD